MRSIRPAQAGEAATLTAVCIRSKAHWGYDPEFMRLSTAALTVRPDAISAGHVLVAVDSRDRPIGVASVVGEGDTVDLDALFVDPPAIASGTGGALFAAAVRVARSRGARRSPALAARPPGRSRSEAESAASRTRPR